VAKIQGHKTDKDVPDSMQDGEKDGNQVRGPRDLQGVSSTIASSVGKTSLDDAQGVVAPESAESAD